jgi:hypothetical protein
MSGLTKKVIRVDAALSTILRVDQGTLVSYSELSKGLHRYIKDKGLKNAPPMAVETTEVLVTTPETLARCRDCGEIIPEGALFCDMCGVRQ